MVVQNRHLGRFCTELFNFRAQKARENLRREGAEEIRRAFEKNVRALGGKRYGAILFQNVIDHHPILSLTVLLHKQRAYSILIRTRITVRENSFGNSFIVI